MFYDFSKRLIDIIISFIGLLLLLPIYIWLSYQVKKNLGMPIFFRQIRPGLNGQPFELVKFRSMKDPIDEKGYPLADEDRLTEFGKKLRESSFDELPELWNVLKGDMSIVGPRPLLMDYLPLYNSEQAKRHDVKPGITGYAQVNGRNSITWEEKFELDIWYVENKSLWVDLKIIIKTLKVVLLKENINFNENATTYMFMGSKKDK